MYIFLVIFKATVVAVLDIFKVEKWWKNILWKITLSFFLFLYLFYFLVINLTICVLLYYGNKCIFITVLAYEVIFVNSVSISLKLVFKNIFFKDLTKDNLQVYPYLEYKFSSWLENEVDLNVLKYVIILLGCFFFFSFITLITFVPKDS